MSLIVLYYRVTGVMLEALHEFHLLLMLLEAKSQQVIYFEVSTQHLLYYRWYITIELTRVYANHILPMPLCH